MFKESDRISCSFPACWNGSAKYQTCLIFHQPSPTLYPDLGSAQLVTILSVISCPIMLPSGLETLAIDLPLDFFFINVAFK